MDLQVGSEEKSFEYDGLPPSKEATLKLSWLYGGFSLFLAFMYLLFLTMLDPFPTALSKSLDDMVVVNTLTTQDRGLVRLPFSAAGSVTHLSKAVEGNARVEIPVEMVAPTLYIPHVNGILQVRINGEILDRERGLEKSSISRPNPVSIAIDNDQHRSLLLDLDLRFFGSSARLDGVYIGEAELVEELKNLQNSWNGLSDFYLGSITIMILLLLIAMISGMITVRSFSLLLTVVLATLLMVSDFTLKSFVLGEFRHYLFLLSPVVLSLLWSVVLTVEGNLYKSNGGNWYLSLGFSCLGLAISLVTRFDVFTINLFLIMPAFALGMFLLWIKIIQLPTFTLGPIMPLKFSLVAASGIALIYDVAFRSGIFDAPLFLSRYIPVFLILFVSLSFLKKMSEVSAKLTKINLEINRQLSMQSKKLEQEAQKSLSLQLQQVATKEREGLTMELHDGVLGHLSIINALSESDITEPVATINKLSKSATQEIRILLNAKSFGEVDLFVILSNLRLEIFDHLRHCGVRGKWDLQKIFDYKGLSTKESMHVVRIVQEAVHNAVVRAGCKRLIVKSFMLGPEKYCIIILNSGGSSYLPSSDPGYGIINMKRRAEQIGASFSISPRESGACIKLLLPSQ